MHTSGTLTTVDALWTIIQSQSKAVRKALAKRLNEAEEQDALSKRMRSYEATLSKEQREAAYNVAERVHRALAGVKKAKEEGQVLPDAHDLFKLLDEYDCQD